MMWRKSWRLPAFLFSEGPTCEVVMLYGRIGVL